MSIGYWVILLFGYQIGLGEIHNIEINLSRLVDPMWMASNCLSNETNCAIGCRIVSLLIRPGRYMLANGLLLARHTLMGFFTQYAIVMAARIMGCY